MSETSAEYIRNARQALQDAAQLLGHAKESDPDPAQYDAITDGWRLVQQARDELAPAAVGFREEVTAELPASHRQAALDAGRRPPTKAEFLPADQLWVQRAVPVLRYVSAGRRYVGTQPYPEAAARALLGDLGQAGASIGDQVAALRAEADRLESQSCTGVAASWCPIHGTCTCVDWKLFNTPGCPLHSIGSSHAERGADWSAGMVDGACTCDAVTDVEHPDPACIAAACVVARAERGTGG